MLAAQDMIEGAASRHFLSMAVIYEDAQSSIQALIRRGEPFFLHARSLTALSLPKQ